MRYLNVIIIAAVTFAALPMRAAATDEKATWSALLENDYFGTTDSNYTNGVRFGYLSAKGRGGRLARRILRVSPDDVTRIGVAVGHSIFTPQDTDAFAPLPDQHPYAGWLYGEYSILVERDSDILDMISLTLGVVGPAALERRIEIRNHLGFP